MPLDESTDQTLVYFVSAFPNQKYTANEENQSAARNLMCEYGKKRRGERHDPSERQQQQKPA